MQNDKWLQHQTWVCSAQAIIKWAVRDPMSLAPRQTGFYNCQQSVLSSLPFVNYGRDLIKSFCVISLVPPPPPPPPSHTDHISLITIPEPRLKTRGFSLFPQVVSEWVFDWLKLFFFLNKLISCDCLWTLTSVAQHHRWGGGDKLFLLSIYQPRFPFFLELAQKMHLRARFLNGISSVLSHA